MTTHVAFKISLAAILLAVFLVATPHFTQSAAPPNDKRVLIISIDGMRPDVLLRAKAPNIREMMQHGSFTLWAESTDLALTLPTHVSMFTGLTPARHHVIWNDSRPLPPGFLNEPTLFDLTKKGGYSTGMVIGKDKLGILAKPGMVDWLKMPLTSRDDSTAISARAAGMLREHRPQVMFVQFNDPDLVGHAIGWGVPEQVAATERVDRGIGILLAELRDLGLREQTLVIVTADHGGSGLNHGAKVPYSRYIPWIASGPGVRENYDLTLDAQPAVHVEDVFATALDFLGIAIPSGTDGKTVSAMYDHSGKDSTSSPKK